MLSDGLSEKNRQQLCLKIGHCDLRSIFDDDLSGQNIYHFTEDHSNVEVCPPDVNVIGIRREQ